MDTKSLRECPVCNEDFNEDTRCPRSLPCSHYLCTQCIDTLINKNKKQCPFCRQNFNVTSAQDITINRALLDLMNCATPQLKRNRKQRDSNATLGYLKEETSEAIESLFLSCVTAKSEAESSLQRVESTNQIIQFGDKKIEEVMLKLVALAEENYRKKNTLEKENKELKDSLKYLEKLEDNLGNIKLKLDAAKTFVETGTLMDEVKNIKADIKKSEEKLKGFSSGGKLQQEIEKDAQKAKENLCKIWEVVNSMKIELNKSDSCPAQKPLITSPNTNEQVTIRELQQRTKKVQKLARQGKLFAIQHQGTTRSAIITMRGNKMLLHHLKEESPPSFASTLKHSEALNIINPSSILAFLELSANDKILGTMYIDLTPDSPGAKQFALLCTGQMGPSYANSNLLNVLQRGSRAEKVRFGDYERNNGGGGKALVTELDSRESYCRPAEAGIVTGVGWMKRNDSVSAQFMISTENNSGTVMNSVFGNVVEGLDILCDAINDYPRIREVRISDCGLVFCGGSRVYKSKHESGMIVTNYV